MAGRLGRIFVNVFLLGQGNPFLDQTVPVILLADPPLQAEIMMRSSIMVSLMLGLPDCTMKTSFSRTLVRIRTLVSP